VYHVQIRNMDHLKERISEACVRINTRCVKLESVVRGTDASVCAVSIIVPIEHVA